jgi:hypothetical protein
MCEAASFVGVPTHLFADDALARRALPANAATHRDAAPGAKVFLLLFLQKKKILVLE